MSEKVIVVYGTEESIESGSVSVISSHNGTRIYDRDKVDSRLLSEDGGLPYFSDLKTALSFIKDNPTKPAQLELSEARRYNLV